MCGPKCSKAFVIFFNILFLVQRLCIVGIGRDPFGHPDLPSCFHCYDGGCGVAVISPMGGARAGLCGWGRVVCWLLWLLWRPARIKMHVGNVHLLPRPRVPVGNPGLVLLSLWNVLLPGIDQKIR